MTATELKDYIDATWARVGSNRISAADMRDVGKKIVDFASALDIEDSIPDWAAGLTFQTDGSDDGKYCKHPDTNGNLRLFETKTDDNIGNTPPTNPAITENDDWEEISPSSAAAIPEWQPGVFGEGLVIVYHNHSVDGRGLYVLLEPVRPFTSENIETEITGGQWAQIAGGSVPANLQRLVNKNSHGFVLKNVLTLDGSGVHVKVSNPSSNKFVGLVTEVVDTNSFRIHTAGYVTGLSGLTAGSIHYGQADGTLGTTVTDMPVLFADSTTSGYILASGASGGGSGIRVASLSGTDTYTASLTPALTAYTTGLLVLANFANDNTGAATLNIDSLGAKDIVVRPLIPVIAGQLSGYKMLFYDGTRFQVVDLPWVSNTSTAKAAYIDASGRLRFADGSLFSVVNRAWQFTGLNNTHNSMFRWQNSDEELLFQIWNDFVSEFGHSGTHVIEVADSITNGNSLFLVPANQGQAYQFQDKSFNKIATLKTTTDDVALIVHGFEKNYQVGFVNKTIQAHVSTASTAATQNTIAAIEVPSGHSIQVRVKSCHAWSETGERMISCHPFIAIGFNNGSSLSGTAETATQVYHNGPSTGGFSINFNDTSKEVEIRLLNETGTGYVYVTDIEFDYILTPIPA